jgi:hypothetical protein
VVDQAQHGVATRGVLEVGVDPAAAAQGGVGPIRVTAESLTSLLGRPRFFNEVAERVDRPGVATGLASSTTQPAQLPSPFPSGFSDPPTPDFAHLS